MHIYDIYHWLNYIKFGILKPYRNKKTTMVYFSK